MYSLGFLVSSGASDGRSIHSLSSRAIMNGIHAIPHSMKMNLMFGKRSGMPFSTRFVICTIA